VSLANIFTLERSPTAQPYPESTNRIVYAASLILLAIGSTLVLYLFVTSLQTIVDLASTIVFLFAPVVAWLNHRVMTDQTIPDAAKPGRGLRLLSVIGIAWLTAFSVYYLLLRFTPWFDG
jgi:Mn2+/Fe2+ NRAMP family transporter